MEKEIYTSIVLSTGLKADIIIIRGKHISKAAARMSRKESDDICILLMCEVCLINGEKQTLSFFEEMISDDYLLLQQVINEVVTNLR